jgi:hypothetical protein
VVKNITHKIGGLQRVKNINLIQKMSAWSLSVQGQKMGAAAETVQKQQKQHTKKWCNKKTNEFKIECCGSFGLLPAENENV